MFIKSNMEIEVNYFKNGHCITIKPNTVTYVDDTIVSPKEIKDCYGDRVSVISEEFADIIIQESAQPVVPPANKETTGDPEVDEFLNTPENDKGDETSNGTESETDTTEEYKKQVAEAEAYFEDLAQDDDSDKHLKLEIKAKLKDEADKDGRCYDLVSLMEEIEELFPAEKETIIKAAQEVEEKAKAKQTSKTKSKAGRPSKNKSSKAQSK